jgi:two-component system response regulator PilR (NtrC family)
MAINCAALPALLMESELFGYVKGAFTGATATKTGLFENAHGGTLFLDEIGAMPLEIQSKLLRVLQDKKIRKVGGSDHTEVDIRIVAASNEKLEKLIEQGKFREDLYYRLSVISIDIPALRNRPEDILPLIDHILRRALGPDAELPQIDHETQNILDNYNWPGNVRELENAIQHAITFAQQGTITKDTLPAKIVDTVEEGLKSGIISCRRDQFKGKSLKAFLHDKEKEFLQRTIENMRGDKEKAASELGISLATLYRKLPSDLKK